MALEFHIVAVGRLKGGFAYLNAGVEDYLKRLQPYARVRVIEVPDEPITPSRTPEQVMAREAERLLPHIQRAALAIALSERGELLGSEKFAARLFGRLGANPSNGGLPTPDPGPIIMIVGGPLGLSPTVLEACQWVLSLSPMTFPHPMVRLIVLEQLYRAFKIHRGEPYHK